MVSCKGMLNLLQMCKCANLMQVFMKMCKINILLTILVIVHCSEGRYQALPLVDTAGCGADDLECDPSAKYRTYDGSCSNLDKPRAAQVGQPYVRHIPATYADGKSEPRRSVHGGPLPRARQVRTALLPDRDVPDHLNTINLMQFGQVVTEDITQKRDRLDKNGDIQNCCTADFQMLPVNQTPEDCKMAIEVCPYDRFYSQYDVRCLSFVLSVDNNNDSCWKYPVEKANFASHVLDAGPIYGMAEEWARSLRSLRKGKLRTLVQDGRVFPPLTDVHERECPPDKTPPDEHICFTSGDPRVNTNTEQVVYHVIYLRLHNILCDRLSELNPHWSDETLYQETRRILGAVTQHFTYKHYLPIILGADFMRAKGLLVDNCYDCCINYYSPQYIPSMSHEFNFAFRTFHSQIPRPMFFVDEDYDVYRTANVDDYMMRASLLLEPGVVDGVLRGLAWQPAQSQDIFFSTAMADHLFKQDRPFGLDLISFDINRGRENGLPTYNEMRHLCGLSRARCFQDLADVMTQESIEKLSAIYQDVDDIDMYVGVLFEEHLPGTLVGPTSQCIVGEQFYLYMRGDRFYYENCGLPWSFTREQLAAIYQTTLSWIFCEGGDDVRSIPVNTFLRGSQQNPIVSCRDIPGLDLSAWREEC